MQIKDRTFIISGGSSGLGLATATLLLFHGAYVSILDLNPPPTGLNETSTSSSCSGSHSDYTSPPNPSRILYMKTDVSSTTSLQSAISSTLSWTRTTSAPLGGVICCAGIGTAALALPRQPGNSSAHTTPNTPLSSTSSPNSPATITPNDTPLNESKFMDMTQFDRTLSINLGGTVDLIRLVLPSLAQNTPNTPSHPSTTDRFDPAAPHGALSRADEADRDEERGVILITSSIAAYEGQVGQLAYAASKGAVASIVLPLARELARVGIRSVGIAPGLFQTGMTEASGKASGTASGTASGKGVPNEGRKSGSGTAEVEHKGAVKDGSAKITGTLNQRGESGNRGQGVGARLAGSAGLLQYPRRLGEADEFARLAKEVIENGMLNGTVIRLDGAVRLPSRL